MSEEDDKPNRQVEPISLEIGKPVTDQHRPGKPVWVTIRELGKGAFGTVYHVVNQQTKEEAALKIETMTAGDNLLKIEREIMNAMKNERSAIHVFDDGIFGEYRFIVMTLCGPDLEKIANQMNWKFRHDTVLRVSIRTLLAIKTLHEAEYVHRDLKPCNFALDYQLTSLNIYLFDYGMARKYARKDREKYVFRRPRQNPQFRGTIQYCSLNMHKLKELGRVDDIWSWLFMAAEMVAPLPWKGVQRQDLAEIRKEEQLLKYFSSVDPFITSTFLPIHNMLINVTYAERPDYAKMFNLLYTKLREVGGNLTGPMEYDSIRLSAKQDEEIKTTMKSLHLNPREPPKVESEQEAVNRLTAEFSKAGVPDGTKHILGEAVDFFGSFKQAEQPERTDEALNRKKAVRETPKEAPAVMNAKNTRNKMLPNRKNASEPNSGGVGNSARPSQVSKAKTGRKPVKTGQQSKTANHNKAIRH